MWSGSAQDDDDAAAARPADESEVLVRIDQFISGEAVACLADALILVESDGSILDANDAALEHYGRRREELLAMNMSDLTGPPLEPFFGGRPASSDETGVPHETQHRRSDGTLFPVEVCAATVFADGQTAVLHSVRDISPRREHEAAMSKMFQAAINVIGHVSESRDPYTTGHERRVSELATAIAIEMSLPESEITAIRLAGLIHDIGKVSVPVEILSVAGQLSSIEFEVVKDHPQAGYEILSSAGMDDTITELVYEHHERCDGTGYPRELAGGQLLMGSKILMVADVVEAMSSPRPHRPALGIEPALAEIVEGSGTRYDSHVAAACVRAFRERGFRFSDAQA